MTIGQLAQRTSKRKESKSKIRELTVRRAAVAAGLSLFLHAVFQQMQLHSVGNRLNESAIENEQIQVKPFINLFSYSV